MYDRRDPDLVDNLIKWHTPKEVKHLSEKSLIRYSESARKLYENIFCHKQHLRYNPTATAREFDILVRSNTPVYNGEISLNAHQGVLNGDITYDAICNEHIHGLRSCYNYVIENADDISLSKLYKLIFKFNTIRKTTSKENRELMKYQTGMYDPSRDPYDENEDISLVQDIFMYPNYVWEYNGEYFKDLGMIADKLGLAKSTLSSTKYQLKHNIWKTAKSHICDISGKMPSYGS